MATSAPRSRAGFTLLEVVLAMTVLALLTTLAYSAFFLGIRVIAKGEVAVVNSQRLRVTQDVFKRQVKSIVAYPFKDAEGDAHWYFSGNETSVTFVTAAGMSGGGGLAKVTYEVLDDPVRLVLKESRFFSPDTLVGGADADALEETLLDGFSGFKLKYCERTDDPEAPCNWVSAWDPMDNEMPLAVGFEIAGVQGLEMGATANETPIMYAQLGDEGEELEPDDALDELLAGVDGEAVDGAADDAPDEAEDADFADGEDAE